MTWQVLIVDDEEDIREGLSSVLRARGYDTIAAVNGNEALEMIRRRGLQPSLVVLDLRMPVLDGVGFLEAQAEDPWLSEVPVVVLTAHHPPRLEFPAVRDVLGKPLDLPQLLAVVRRACTARRPAQRPPS